MTNSTNELRNAKRDLLAMFGMKKAAATELPECCRPGADPAIAEALRATMAREEEMRVEALLASKCRFC